MLKGRQRKSGGKDGDTAESRSFDEKTVLIGVPGMSTLASERGNGHWRRSMVRNLKEHAKAKGPQEQEVGNTGG